MKEKILIGLLSLSMLVLAITPALAALNVSVGLENIRGQTEYGNADLTIVVGKIIKVILGFLGVIALVIAIVGGFQWMTSGGNEEKITAAKKLISAGVAGLFIILIAYAATTFVVNIIAEQVEGG